MGLYDYRVLVERATFWPISLGRTLGYPHERLSNDCVEHDVVAWPKEIHRAPIGCPRDGHRKLTMSEIAKSWLTRLWRCRPGSASATASRVTPTTVDPNEVNDGQSLSVPSSRKPGTP
jgi:hypothetical protein